MTEMAELKICQGNSKYQFLSQTLTHMQLHKIPFSDVLNDDIPVPSVEDVSEGCADNILQIMS